MLLDTHVARSFKAPHTHTHVYLYDKHSKPACLQALCGIGCPSLPRGGGEIEPGSAEKKERGILKSIKKIKKKK